MKKYVREIASWQATISTTPPINRSLGGPVLLADIRAIDSRFVAGHIKKYTRRRIDISRRRHLVLLRRARSICICIY